MQAATAWQESIVKSESQVIDEARKECKNSSCCKAHGCMSPQKPKTGKGGVQKMKKGRVVLRGEVVKDDSGSHAVFTEQRSSASHMTAAKVLGVISRLPGCAGQASDAPKLWGLPESECPSIWSPLPRSRCPKSWDKIQDAVVPCERNLHGLPSAGFLWERLFERVLIENGWDKVPN